MLKPQVQLTLGPRVNRVRLLRYVFAEFTPKIERMTRFPTDLGDGVIVTFESLANTEEVPLGRPPVTGPTVVMSASLDVSTVAVLVASVPVQVELVNTVELKFDDDARQRAEYGLRFVAASLSVQSQIPYRLWSPTPYLALAGDDTHDHKLLTQCVRVRMPKVKGFYPMAGPGLEWPLDLASLTDRRDGVLLLGAAVAAFSSTASLVLAQRSWLRSPGSSFRIHGTSGTPTLRWRTGS
jgi:hypothetical protein